MADEPTSALGTSLDTGIPDFDTWYKDNHGGSSAYGLLSDIENFFTGSRNSAQAQYDKAYNEWFEGTRYQRAFQDIKNAGYNPWILLQNGSPSSSGSANSGLAINSKKNGGSDLLKALANTASMITKIISVAA